MVKAIAFDFNGVIEIGGGNPNKLVAEYLEIPFDVFKKEYFQNNHLNNIEDKSYEDVVVITAGKLGITDKEEEIRNIIKECLDNRSLNKELVELIKTLKENGYKTALLSNNSSKLRDYLKEKDLLDIFDSVIISAEVGFQKPNKEIFECLFKDLEVEPNEVIFVDDAEKSLENADEIGFTPILFENNDKLKQDLEKLDILNIK